MRGFGPETAFEGREGVCGCLEPIVYKPYLVL